MSQACVIETHDLTKQYGTFDAVRSLNLRVAGQRITGFPGRNGAGKSTTIKMLLGMTHPTSGTGTVLGKSISNSKANTEMRREVAYAAEDKQLYQYLSILRPGIQNQGQSSGGPPRRFKILPGRQV